MTKNRKNKRKAAAEQHKEDIIRYEPNTTTGLSAQQVAERISQCAVNSQNNKSDQTIGKIIRSNVFTYFNLIFFLIASILIYEGSYNNLTFLIVVIVDLLIGIFQEMKSKKILDHLSLMSAPETTVIRDNKTTRIPCEQIVLDDIVVYEAGNQISVDGIICSGELLVNEALVTGEADEILKVHGDTILSGSFVIGGKAKIRVEKVGSDCFASQLAKDAKKIKKKQPPGMMKSLTRLIQIIGILIIPFATIMFLNQHIVLGLSEKVSVENSAASVLGMIPEGLYLLTSIALAASTIRLAKQNTLVHDMKCIEALARVDILCVDKTGTITEPDMQVEGLLCLSDVAEEVCSQKISEFVQCMDAGNETMKALKHTWGNSLSNITPLRLKHFSSATKYSAVDFGNRGTYLLGAPEVLLHDNFPDVWEQIHLSSSHGERVLLFASYEYEKNGADDIFEKQEPGKHITPLALITLSNGIRPQAEETFTYFQDQGVAIKVISGDSALTAALAAQKAGINAAEQYIDVTDMSNEDLQKAAIQYTVFGRVTPEQKRLLVQTLKKAGHTVAMTGDGVNDVLALKDADCGIAMASGSEAAAQVSDLVLLNSDFSGMPQVVAEGRRVINNIQRSASLFLVKNIFSFILSIISVFSVSLYPLKPAQISLISGLMIGFPSFILALEPNYDLVTGKFLRNVLFRAFPAALTAVVLVEWSLLFTNAFQIGPELASTIAFYLYAFAAYLMLFRVCRPLDWKHCLLFILMGIAFLLAVNIFSDWFQIAALDYKSGLILSPLLLLTLPIDYAFHWLFAKIVKLKIKLQEHIEQSKGRL